MSLSVFNVVKAPMGWSIFADNVKLGGVYGSREAALEAATLAASYALDDGTGVQINIPAIDDREDRRTPFDVAAPIANKKKR